MNSQSKQLQEQLWAAAEQMRGNSSLNLNEISAPILGLIFLKFAEVKFKKAKEQLEKERASTQSTRQRPLSADDYKAKGVLYVPEKATYSFLINLPENENLGKALNEAMEAIEEENRDLAGLFRVIDESEGLDLLDVHKDAWTHRTSDSLKAAIRQVVEENLNSPGFSSDQLKVIGLIDHASGLRDKVKQIIIKASGL